MVDQVGKWTAGPSYGPVLSQTDLYLLNTDLELNPILTGNHGAFHLVFNLATGQTGGFNPASRDQDLPFSQKEEPATLPRVTELIVITEISPWCTTVKNERGVTLGDVCSAVWKDYTEHFVTDAEFQALPPRLQDQIRRMAANSAGNWNMYYTPAAAAPSRYKRVDWLRDRQYFDGMRKDPSYVASRLGFKAPNIFIMSLTQ
ncbi:hypothetical protein HGRIS_013762 [Hohenbuehelia grisea]|uniref:DUF6699 domain-containing protein n=1 Tax=Hohenbuehelia grisea TaxID=104357 RepID=A0ABR3IWD0_9AGAR